MIQTRYFRISPGSYVRQIAGVWAGRWGWALALPLALCIAAGLYRPIFFVVAIGLVLVLYPGILAMLYFNYALRPEAALAVLSHRVDIEPSGLTISYEGAEGHRTPQPRRLPIEQVRLVEDAGTALVIHLASSPYDVIAMPADSFEDGDFACALAILQQKMA